MKNDRSGMREMAGRQKGWLAQKVVQESKNSPGRTKDQPAVFLSLLKPLVRVSLSLSLSFSFSLLRTLFFPLP